MSSLVKYRVKEVAADFGVTTKEITEIISKYYEKPKSNSQVLTTEELNALFDHMTQHNQIQDLSVVFAATPKAPEKKPEPVKAEQPKPQQAQTASKPQAQNKPQTAPLKPPKAEYPKEPERGYDSIEDLYVPGYFEMPIK